MTELGNYLEFAKRLALEAGKIIKQNFVIGMDKEWKTDTTPVTSADTTINKMVIDKVSEQFPNHSVHGEEGDKLGTSEYQWVCDPVDGTMPFSHGVQIATFALGLVKNGEPIVGVVYDPFMDRLFWAVKGQGAYLNNKKISVSDGDFSNALIDLEGFPSTKPVIEASARFIDMLNKKGAHTTVLWSGILPCALVAAGQYTACIYNVPKPEEGAAIKILIEEAGGKVTDLFGNEQRYDQPVKGVLASNGKVHKQLVDMLAVFNLKQ
jgi:fructose-1,6-bisphosphatase/inositol monophosphatase family enzyme